MIMLLIFASVSAQEKSRSEFFREFYGTFLKSTDIEIPQHEVTIGTKDLEDVIKQMEERYNIVIPAEDKAKFRTLEDVAEYINRYITSQTADLDRETTKRKPQPWKFKLYGSYGIMEPEGVTGTQGWYGNLGKIKRNEGLNLFGNTYTWEAGFALQPYGWHGKPGRSGNSFGVSYDYSAYDQWSSKDTTYTGNDTTAFRYGISLNFQHDLTGRRKDRPRVGLYLVESLRFGVHTYGFTGRYSVAGNGLWDKNHLSVGVGLAQGIYFYIFDLKLYQNVAYNWDIVRIRPDLPILRTLDVEVGLRLGIALKL